MTGLIAEELIVSVSGIRGIVGQSLTAATALAFAQALGTHTQGGKIVLSRDGRPSGRMLGHAILAGLLGTGCEVHDLGVAPTPTCGLAVRRLQAQGGIQITASHNPSEWNGLKLFGPDGAVLTALEGLKIQQIFSSGKYRQVDWSEQGQTIPLSEALDWHLEKVLELVKVESIRGRKLIVFLDANGGAGGPLGKKLLQALGCRVVVEKGDADGFFAHPPEPLAENLQSILSRIEQVKADLGFVLDPDADRLAIIDETGRYIGEELTLALAVLFRLQEAVDEAALLRLDVERSKAASSTEARKVCSQGIVINMSTSRVVEDIAARFGVPCYRSKVGEANVVEKMREINALIGGEGNGGVIDPRVGWVRDPFIGMALVLSLMARTGKKLSELVDELPAYHIVKDKYTLPRHRLAQVNELLESRWPEAKINSLDGLRLDWETRWVHVRPSNTEPIVRVIAEANRPEEAQQLCREVGTLLGNA